MIPAWSYPQRAAQTEQVFSYTCSHQTERVFRYTCSHQTERVFRYTCSHQTERVFRYTCSHQTRKLDANSGVNSFSRAFLKRNSTDQKYLSLVMRKPVLLRYENEKTYLIPYQTTNKRSLISAFVVRYLGSITPILTTFKFQNSPASVAERAGLSLDQSYLLANPTTSFLMTWFNSYPNHCISEYHFIYICYNSFIHSFICSFNHRNVFTD